MSKRERDEKEDEGGVEKHTKMSRVSETLEISETLKNLEKMKAFLKSEFERKASVKGRGGETYLHYAASLGHVEATKVLLQNGANVNAVDDCIWTALHHAADEDHVDVAKVLLEYVPT